MNYYSKSWKLTTYPFIHIPVLLRLFPLMLLANMQHFLYTVYNLLFIVLWLAAFYYANPYLFYYFLSEYYF